MLHLLLAAALSTETARPLFVPPKGMVSVPEDRRTRSEVAHSSDAQFIAEYRGFASVKPSWSNVAYKVPETIAIVRHRGASINADEYGVKTLEGLTSTYVPPSALAFCAHRAHCTINLPVVKKLSARPVALCGGRRGWMNAVSRHDTVYQQVFARAGDSIYVAVLRYDMSPGDTLHAAKALTSLCPEGVGEASAPALPIPLSAPVGWMRGAGNLDDAENDPFYGKAYWFSLAPASSVAQWITLGEAPDYGEDVTPQQEAQSWLAGARKQDKSVRILASRAVALCGGSAGWLTQYTGSNGRGGHYTTEDLFAYGGNASYLLEYVRDSREPENPAAHAALHSLCPSQSADSSR